MLTPEMIERLKDEEEKRRREEERPSLRIPVDEMPRAPEMGPEVERTAATPPGSTVVVLDMSQDDVEEFRVVTW